MMRDRTWPWSHYRWQLSQRRRSWQLSQRRQRLLSRQLSQRSQEAPVTAVEPEAQVAKAPLEAPAPKAKAKGRPRGSKDKQAHTQRINRVPAEQAEPEQMALDNFPQELHQPVSHVDFDIGKLMWAHLQAHASKETGGRRWRDGVVL